jgi:Adenylate and Guanylate cyclase catalytic domain
MDFYAVLDQAVDLLRQRGRVTYRALKIQFKLDDDQLEALKDELLFAHPQVVDNTGRGLLWTGTPAAVPPAVAPAPVQDRTPLAYTPPHLAEQILTSRAALEGERKPVTVLFADLKGSMELLAERDPEEARQLLDPVLDRMMAAVHQYEGTVNQVMGDGIMALFGAPLAHEDHAVRACYAPWASATRRPRTPTCARCASGWRPSPGRRPRRPWRCTAPRRCVYRNSGTRTRCGMDRVICWFTPGGLVPHRQVLAGMQRFAAEVMPAGRGL